MSRRITAGNDAPFRWAVKLQGKPFELSGKDVKVYVINSRGEIPVARHTIEGHEVSGVFEGRYQTRLGEHSLVLRVNEGRPEMKTGAVANAFELVQWSADAGGSDEGDVIVAPVLIESELSIGGGSSYDDRELREAIEDLDTRVAAHAEEIVNLQENKAEKSELTELSAEVGKKQDTITDLATIREGAAKGATAIQEVKTINGQSIVGSGNVEIQGGGGGGMTTPSGDPMHYMYEAVGAEWNGTGADIEKQGVYGDTITWKAGYWWLNELGDITNEEMREIYLFSNLDNSAKGVAQLMQGITTRTNIATWQGTWNNKIKDNQLFGYAYNLITAMVRNAEAHYLDGNTSYMFVGCTSLEKIFPTFDATSTTSFNGIFSPCQSLREVRIKNAKVPIKFTESPLISKASILYLIQNSAATSAMAITLHADTYARLKEDADIVAALASHPNVSLAK